MAIYDNPSAARAALFEAMRLVWELASIEMAGIIAAKAAAPAEAEDLLRILTNDQPYRGRNVSIAVTVETYVEGKPCQMTRIVRAADFPVMSDRASAACDDARRASIAESVDEDDSPFSD